MVLDGLFATIETIKHRIGDHETSIAANETRTRRVLIDPLLRVLGWDVEDPDIVGLEYKVGDGFADYALLADGQPVAVVEAKKLNESLSTRDENQVLKYAVSEGIKYMILTNGDEWRMYDVFIQAPTREKLVMQMTISADQTHESVLKSLMIWNANLKSRGDVIDPSQPVMDPDRTDSSQTSDSQLPTSDEEWQSIRGSFSEDVKPFAAKFGGRAIEITSWKHLAVEYATWMINEGKITPKDCPVPTAEGRHFINTDPVHADGSQFERVQTLPKGMWMDAYQVDTWWIGNTRRLVRRFDVDIYVKIEK